MNSSLALIALLLQLTSGKNTAITVTTDLLNPSLTYRVLIVERGRESLNWLDYQSVKFVQEKN